jgi:extracellular elastinolytic metalloproteinase
MPPKSRDYYIARAVAHAAAKSPKSVTFAPTGDVHTTRSRTTIVFLQQHVAGIPVQNAVRSVRFGRNGRAIDFTGTWVSVPADTPLVARVSALGATQAAAEYLARTLPRGAVTLAQAPTIVAEFGLRQRPAVLSMPPFADPIVASLVILFDRGRYKLAWDVRLSLPRPGRSHSVLVSAARPKPGILSARRRSSHAVSGDVHVFDPAPSTPPLSLPFPPLRKAFPSFGGKQIPKPVWVAAAATTGNNVSCVDDRGKPFTGMVNGADVNFAPVSDIDRARVGTFYHCNYLHDFFLLLGFDEAAGNFQTSNDPGVGSGNDAVRVTAWNSAIEGMAHFVNRPDGHSPELNMGLRKQRHSGLDADIIIHEYIHGVTDRIIGGRSIEAPLVFPQSRALGEGFSDYFALTLQNFRRSVSGMQPKWAFGSWIADDTTKGLRKFSYDPATFPGTYGMLGKKDFKEDQDAGTVWCAALLGVHAVLGDERTWQLVFASLQELHPLPKGPTFIDARSVFVRVFDEAVAKNTISVSATARDEMLAAFKRRGLGPTAKCKDGGFQDIEEDK